MERPCPVSSSGKKKFHNPLERAFSLTLSKSSNCSFVSSNNNKNYVFGIPYKKIKKIETLNKKDSKSLFYIRVLVDDKPGIIAAITGILRDYKISIKSLFQEQVNNKSFNVVILTQNINYQSIFKASLKLNKCKFLKESSKVLQVLHI